MPQLDKALNEISTIRLQVARTTVFRGYGPATMASTSFVAIVAGLTQSLICPRPQSNLTLYLSIWILAATISASLIAFQTVTRARRIHSSLADEMIHMAVEQFLPCFVAGSLLTAVLVTSSSAVTWMLPGLWQIIFSLGVFSSCRFLPWPMLVAGAWYLLTGVACIAAAAAAPLSPFAMAVPFAVGQLIVAAVLYFSAGEQWGAGAKPGAGR